MDIPVSADVECVGGPCGHSWHLISSALSFENLTGCDTRASTRRGSIVGKGDLFFAGTGTRPYDLPAYTSTGAAPTTAEIE